MTARATYDDANLILRLYEMRREPRMREARAWFTSKCKPASWAQLQEIAPAGSQENASFRQVVTYWDMVASFVTSGVLNKELFFQSGRELLLVWERLRPVIAEARAAYKDPHYLSNLEKVGDDFAVYFEARSGEGYEAFLRRIG